MNIAVIGAGAAGYFSAIFAASNPKHSVTIFEKSGKILSKVKVSGGGRCNVTNANFDERLLHEYYPRGNKELRNAFSRFSKNETVEWFQLQGVTLKSESDGRMFPVTDNSETIVQCLTTEAARLKVKLKLNHSLKSIVKQKSSYELQFLNNEVYKADKIIITTGGSPLLSSYGWIEAMGHSIVPPVPSLFTFNLPSSPLKGLEGISAQVRVKLEGLNFESIGPLLITHWGISGPAVLKLSSFAARWLFEKNYSADCLINWTVDKKEDMIRNELINLRNANPRKRIVNDIQYNLTARLWTRLCELSQITETENWADVNNIRLNKLAINISGQRIKIGGKTTFKEEFVTCGGVNLKEIDFKTMQSKIDPGIHFAGEVLDIDGVTGGFNFQAAWTTGFLAGINV